MPDPTSLAMLSTIVLIVGTVVASTGLLLELIERRQTPIERTRELSEEGT